MIDWRKLRGKQVVVTASGIQYRGIVVEVGERSLLLRATGGHREIPWEQINKVREESDAGNRGRSSILG